MKKLLLLPFFLLLLALGVNAQCAGSSSYTMLEGDTITLTSPSFNSVTNWMVISDAHGMADSDIFSNEVGCSADFYLPIAGTYTVQADDAGGSGSVSMTVTVDDVLSTVGFGHQCYVIDTTNCADIYSYGDIVATSFVDAQEIYTYGYIHADQAVLLGGTPLSPSVILNTTFVSIPETYIAGSLEVLGLIKGSSGVTIDDDADITGDLVVSGSTYLYRVNTLSNAGNPITIIGDVDNIGDLVVTGLLNAGNLTVLNSIIAAGDITANTISATGDIVASGNVRVTGADDRLQGSVNLIGACDARSARIYSSGSNVILELGDTSATCASGEPCTVDADCSSGSCDTSTYTCT